ncbi:MAG: Gx transporter family protein [Lachnospiraceae bacterium]|nr:Gx transporter family protein [Lachnospiraceae bacterium]
MRRSKTSQLTICALLISMALVLSYMERFFPLQMLIPLPGIKLGLANIVTVMALYFFGEKHAFAILILRCVLGSVFGGGISGLAFSLTGGLLAMTTMSVIRRLGLFSVYGVSVLGAASHNIGQILVAMFLMNSVYVAGYLPYLLAVSVFTGMATGAACAGVFKALIASGQIPEETN